MTRIFILLAATLLLHGVGAHAEVVSVKDWKKYKSWAKAFYPERDVALAVAPNGSNCSDAGRGQAQAKANALRCCKTSQHNPSNANCKIVAVNFKSTNRSSSTASTSGSNSVWCVGANIVFETMTTVPWMFFLDETYCRNKHGKGFSTKSQAEAEHQRLKKQTTTASTSSKVWCATKGEVWSTNASCGSGVRVFSNKAKAQAEHKRLKEIATASSIQAPQQTTAQTGSAEIVFWQSIKGSDDPDMYREYLRQFPSGVYAGLAKIKINKLSNTAVAKASIPNLEYGNYHALVIGNNDYRHLGDLETAINDANAIGRVLKDDYGFAVKVLINATRADILDTFSQYRRKVSAKDNLLIYFAGHGHLDRDMDEGYWLPIDAVEDSFTNWISNSSIISSVRGMQAKHVMVVADSCFSGTLVRAVKITPRTPGSLQKFVNLKARTALTSGGIEPVTDVGGGQHSVFARAFLSLLEQNPAVMNGQELFVALRRKVQLNADQIPEYGDIRKAGHDGGDFLFVRQ